MQGVRSQCRRQLATAIVLFALLGACGRNSGAHKSSAESETSGTAATAGATVSRIGDRVITSAELDRSVQLPLHDVDMQKYRLRRQALEAAVLRTLEREPTSTRTAAIMLEPPVPPRLDVPTDSDRMRPARTAAVTVLAFCDFESPHCARLQVTLSQVLPLFPGVVRYAERSLPLDYHRHARQAAEAAQCALEQGNYWRFHDLLYAEGGTPDRAMLDRVSHGANLEPKAFALCLDSGRGARAVAVDVALAGSLRLTTVPAVFVNGLYASPDVTAADLVWLIDRELASLKVASPRLVPATTRTNAPFELKGLLVSRVPGQSVAVVTPSIARDRGMLFREGDAMATGVVLRRIDANGIDLAHDGKLERLPVGARAAAPAQAVDDSAALAAANPHQAVPVTLDRNRVLVLLSDRIALAQALEPVPMTAGGQRLMKLQVVAPGSLFELLGLQPGDVILGVNEQPVTETINPLWDALQTQDEVRLRVMRRGGLARHYTYRFDK